jgi:hypothetical protein
MKKDLYFQVNQLPNWIYKDVLFFITLNNLLNPN